MSTRIGPFASARWPSSGGANRIGRSAEGTKNASPCVATSTPSCTAKTARRHRPMLVQGVAVAVAELMQQPRRAFHVREQQSDDTGGEVERHCAGS